MPTSCRFALFAIALLPVNGGCGLLFNEESREVLVESTPTGSEVKIRGERVGRTPVRVEVPTNEETAIVVEREGYGSQICYLDPSIEPVWLILDIWFLVPLVVDAATGRWNDVPDQCTVALGRFEKPTSDRPAKPRSSPLFKPQPEPKPDDDPPPDPADKPKPFPFPK